MSEFVEECRREWKRLRVPDPVANEMAADLEADLAEAEAEGDSPEQVLGSGAFDPRSFAASWAAARGVAAPAPDPPPPPYAHVTPTDPALRPTEVAVPGLRVGERPSPRPRVTWMAAVAAAAVLAVLLVGLALAGVRSGSSSMAVPARFGVGPTPAPPASPQSFVVARGFGPGDHLRAVGAFVLVVGLLCLVFAALYWSPWADQIRRRTVRRS